MCSLPSLNFNSMVGKDTIHYEPALHHSQSSIAPPEEYEEAKWMKESRRIWSTEYDDGTELFRTELRGIEERVRSL